MQLECQLLAAHYTLMKVKFLTDPEDHNSPYPDSYSALSHENSIRKIQHGHEYLLDKIKIISIYKAKPSLVKGDFLCIKASPGSLCTSQMGLPLHKEQPTGKLLLFTP